MTDTKPVTYTKAETTILSKLLEAKEPVAKPDLMAGVTDGDNSFMALISKLRRKGFVLDPGPRGRGALAAYSLTDAERKTLKAAGF